MNESSSSLRFTVEERILLHLLDYIYYRSKIEVPKFITQEGISLTIRVHRKHLPRSLKSLIEKNLILEKIINWNWVSSNSFICCAVIGRK